MEGVETMHGDLEVVGGPTKQEIVRSVWEHTDFGGNDRRIDLSWAAGFFDGEGHIGLHRSRVRRGDGKTTFALQLSMAQIDHRLLTRFVEIMGGQVRRYPVTQGGDRAPYKSVWYAWGPEALGCLTQMLPFLVGKREQAEVAIAFQDKKMSHSRVRATDDEIAWQQSCSDELVRLREQIKANS